MVKNEEWLLYVSILVGFLVLLNIGLASYVFIDWIKKRRGARVTMPIEFNTETEYSTTRIELATEQNLSANQVNLYRRN
ncbi:hypothetical protein M3Y98_00947200 [Aphelenchoides besseyi]|nr:hypothetical protein M3Y98_00947200 [Aphelenchoides besseyi]